MKDKKNKGKYGTKSPKMQFFHKYTGAIVLGFIAISVILVWGYWDSEKVFFENWSCNDILSVNSFDTMTEKELQRYHEIVSTGCNEFAPP